MVGRFLGRCELSIRIYRDKIKKINRVEFAFEFEVHRTRFSLKYELGKTNKHGKTETEIRCSPASRDPGKISEPGPHAPDDGVRPADSERIWASACD